MGRGFPPALHVVCHTPGVPCGCPGPGHLMTGQGLSYRRCQIWERRKEMGSWVLSRVRGGIGEWSWSTWTWRNLGVPLSTTERTRVGVRAARAAADALAEFLTAPAGAGAAFVAVEGMTKGDDGGTPRHHLHSLCKGDVAALRDAEKEWRRARGHVLVRVLSEADAAAALGEYVAKDATKAMGYFAVGGQAWRTWT